MLKRSPVNSLSPAALEEALPEAGRCVTESAEALAGGSDATENGRHRSALQYLNNDLIGQCVQLRPLGRLANQR